MKLLKVFHVTAWSLLLFITKPLLVGVSLLQVVPVHSINWFDLSIILLGGVGLVLGITPRFRALAGGTQIAILLLKTLRHHREQRVAQVLEFETLQHADDTGARG